MRSSLLQITIMILLSACGGSSKKFNSKKYLDIIHKEGTVNLEQIRGSEVEMLSEVVIENEHEAWINLTIKYEDSYEDYVLVLNKEVYMFSDEWSETHDILGKILDIPFVLYEGKMTLAPDIDSDGSPEYHISAESPDQKGKTDEFILSVNDNSEVSFRFSADYKLDNTHNIRISEHIEFDTVSAEQPIVIVIGSQEHMTKPRILFAHYQMPYTWDHDNGYLRYSFACKKELYDGSPNLAGLYQLDANWMDYLIHEGGYEVENDNQRSLFDWLGDLHRRLQFCQDQPDEWDITVLLDRLSGVPFQNPTYSVQRTDLVDPNFYDTFYNVNPDFIYWASENLIPDPGQKELNGFFFQYLYDRLLVYGTRTMAATYLYLHNDDEYELNLEDYIRASSGEQYNVYGELGGYLERRYEDFNATDFGIEELDPDYGYYNDHISFWLRRGLDGSSDALWKSLEKLLKLYDPVWLDQNSTVSVDGDLVSEEEYNMAKRNMTVPSFVPDHERLSDVKIDENRIDIYCDNDLVVTFEQNNSDDERMANYSLSGYLVPYEMVIIEYHGWEWGDYKCVRLSDGEQIVLEDPVFSPSGEYVFQLDSNSEYDRISMGRSSDEYWEGVFWYSDTELYARKPFTNGAEYYKLYIVK